MSFKSSLYIDLGTTNTIIYYKNKGFLLNQPSVMAYRNQGGSQSLLALGQSAKQMIGKNPGNISIVRPLREGVIADFEDTAKMLAGFLKSAKENNFLFRPDILISLPCQVTNFEKEAVKEAALSLGASRVRLIDEPLAAAIGADLPVTANRGMMIVDIGGGTTEIAVISCGGVVLAEAVRVGGNDLDAAIVDYVRNHFNFVIGEPTAERLKMEIGNALTSNLLERPLSVGGFDLNKGLPTKLRLTSRSIFPALDGTIKLIISSIKKALEKIPPEIAGDIAENGLVLAGGGALLHGLKERIQAETGLVVSVTRDPLLSVALGGAKTLENDSLLDFVAS
jgi:rod shape-determining protein MreB